MTRVPPLESLYYHITSRCNLKCKHCWVDADTNPLDELSIEEAKEAILQAIPLGLRNVKLTGGEPFILPWLMDFLKFINDKGLSLGFETNGTLISKKIAYELSKMNVSSLAISLDGSTAKIHDAFRGVEGCFEKTLDGIKNLTENKISLGILVAVDRTNINDLPQLITLVDSLGANYIKFNVLLPLGRALDLNDETFLTFEERKELFMKIPELEKNVNISIQMAFPPLLSPASSMRRGMCVSCRIMNILGLLADGSVAMCGIGNTDSRLIYGNIKDTSLKEIWVTNPPEILSKLRCCLPEGLTGVCGKCIFKYSCKGSCRAIAYEQYGDIASAFPLCQEQYDLGMVTI